MHDPPRRLIIGVGNPDRGDDAVGLRVVRLLQGRLPADMRLVTCGGGAAELLTLFEPADQVVIVDAAISGAPPGHVHRVDCADGQVPALPMASSHGLGVAEAIGLAQVLGCMPSRCVVYAIEAEGFAIGTPISPAVARAAADVAARIVAEASPPAR